MTAVHRAVATSGLALLAAVLASPVLAQGGDASCILAGRLSANAAWAPRAPGVDLLSDGGKVMRSADKQALAGVRQVRLSAPALLSKCDGTGGQLALGPEAPGTKSPVPAVGPGLLSVEAVNFLKLRSGGELVELRVTPPAYRVVMLTR